MKDLFFMVVSSLLLGMSIAGCGDDGPSDTSGETDTTDMLRDVPGTDTDSDEATEEEVTPGNYDEEPQGADEEWGDCINGCDHIHEFGLLFDLTDLGYDGLYGIIDDQSHVWDDYTAADVDLLALLAPGRTMVEITVEPADGESLIRPVIQAHDGFNVMTFNNRMAQGTNTSRTVIAAPYIAGLPFYVAIEENTNYQNLTSGPYVGGEHYDYIVRFETSAFAPVELGELNAGNSPLVVNSARLEQGGDLHYYRFYAPATSVNLQKPTVTFTRTGSTSFVGYLAGMKTIGGDLVFVDGGYAWDEDEDGAVTLPGSAFTVCDPTPCEGNGEYIFMVSDWSGTAFPGDFTYNLEVSLP